MAFDLVKARVISFVYGLLTLIIGGILTAVLSVLAGPEFHALVIANFGDGMVSSFLFLIVAQIVAHVRNMTVVANFEKKVGADRAGGKLNEAYSPITLI